MAHGLRRLSAFFAAIAVGTSSVVGYGFPDCVDGPLANNTVCDTSKDAVTRATALIELWTDAELTNNTVNASPGVPRLGLPAYNWWSEALVSRPSVSSTSEMQPSYESASRPVYVYFFMIARRSR